MGFGEEPEYDLELCKARPSHWRNNQHDYVFSGLLGRGLDYPTLPWTEARKFCRRRCMDLVSIETELEHRLVRRHLAQVGAGSVWTSGHICDHSVSEQCYDDPSIQPRRVYGWFWVGSSRRLEPTNDTTWDRNPWDQKDGPQPDNGAEDNEDEEEGCLAVQGQTWHDLNCSLEREWLCEDSTELLTKAGLNQPI